MHFLFSSEMVSMGIKTTFGIIENSEFKVVSVRPASVRPTYAKCCVMNLSKGFQPIDLKPFGIDYIYNEDVHLPF